MDARLPVKILLSGLTLSAAAVLLWSPRSQVQPHSIRAGQSRGTFAHETTYTSTASVETPAPMAPAPRNLRSLFRESRNYAEFVRAISDAAAAGDPIAEFLTAKALKYCHDTMHWRVRAQGGSLRTRNELEVRTGRYPPSLQQDILDAYDRCRDFFQDVGQEDRTNAWENWLDRAVAAGYPPALSLKSDVARMAEMMRDVAGAPSGDVLPMPVGPARDLAVTAALSGDPESIFDMMNWVDGSHRSGEEYWVLSSAWGLLACQRGYDGCDPTSGWLRSVCSWDVQCADDASAVDMLRRQLGSHFDDAQRLAEEIGRAIDNQDVAAIEAHL